MFPIFGLIKQSPWIEKFRIYVLAQPQHRQMIKYHQQYIRQYNIDVTMAVKHNFPTFN